MPALTKRFSVALYSGKRAKWRHSFVGKNASLFPVFFIKNPGYEEKSLETGGVFPLLFCFFAYFLRLETPQRLESK